MGAAIFKSHDERYVGHMNTMWRRLVRILYVPCKRLSVVGGGTNARAWRRDLCSSGRHESHAYSMKKGVQYLNLKREKSLLRSGWQRFVDPIYTQSPGNESRLCRGKPITQSHGARGPCFDGKVLDLAGGIDVTQLQNTSGRG